jgi:hypothetical protein
VHFPPQLLKGSHQQGGGGQGEIQAHERRQSMNGPQCKPRIGGDRRDLAPLQVLWVWLDYSTLYSRYSVQKRASKTWEGCVARLALATVTPTPTCRYSCPHVIRIANLFNSTINSKGAKRTAWDCQGKKDNKVPDTLSPGCIVAHGARQSGLESYCTCMHGSRR